MRCHNCGSTKVDTDPASGTTFCVQCGGVLEENNIVAEVAFQELSGGKTVLQGAFAGESGRISSGGPFGHGRGKEGQEQAIDNGRQRIARLAHGLKLPERYREAAQRYYNLAVVNRFTRGRKSDHVAAVCLYIVCRNEQSSQMLIDFSDLLQTNVFVLGATFLKLVRVLCLQLPLIDPSIYISRFAAACDFGEYTQRVATDAVRLVQRMDRDWIRTGRRPAGICGACLLIAARINGFKRSVREMIYIVKVADQTILRRLKEFGHTESAQLTVRDFRDIWLETEADPPAYIKNRQEAELAKAQRDSGIASTKDDTLASQERADGSALWEGSTLVDPSPSQAGPSTQDLDATQVLTGDEESSSTDPKFFMVNPKLEEEANKLESEMEDFMPGAIKASEEMAEYDTESSETPALVEDVSLSDVDDEEIEAMILTPEEVECKTMVWYNANKDYLEELAAKHRKMEMDKKNGVFTTRRKIGKRKRLPAAANPAEAAKQLIHTRKISKKINQAVFDDMFESPENIAKIKEMDRLKRTASSSPMPTVVEELPEVVEESGELPPPKSEQENNHSDEDEDEEDMDEDEMADDEILLRKAREQFDWIAAGEDFDDVGYDDDY
ncbi:cyclin-like protein [Hesseltinella vesiculosa]|uniref:B-related factor 1 n=1 Tax=Hesseltinella vesiculosa TaxID=101127 RepID=A0A1X2GST5_9FUNG|nr:cyclin-like protein [Hesseltinella vesiculosa]